MPNNIYSTQSRFGFFGARWACAVAALVIIIEHIRKSIGVTYWAATEIEIERIGGRFLRLGNQNTAPPVYVSNYKDHRDVFDGDKVDDGWSAAADPEAHYFIREWRWTLAEIADIMGVDLGLINPSNYEIWVVDVDGNPFDNKVSTHFIPTYNGREISNPDPRLSGPVVETRKLPV